MIKQILLSVILATASLGVMRARSLESVDALLSWTMGQATYPLKTPLEQQTVRNKDTDLAEFSQKYNYFSEEHPIIAKVTDKAEDFALMVDVIQRLKGLSLDEALTKILAYRQLKAGDELTLAGEPYIVDKVFDLKGGMPAFGLVSKEKRGTPLLIFRGTELTLFSSPGRTSIFSDFDHKGVGYQTFRQAQPMIHDWLTEHPHVKVMGFSLGGTLAAYTFLYEEELVNEAVSFCPAGVSKQVWEDWDRLPPGRKSQLTTYVSLGDWVSKKGMLVGKVSQLSTKEALRPIAAHVTMLSFQKIYYITTVD